MMNRGTASPPSVSPAQKNGVGWRLWSLHSREISAFTLVILTVVVLVPKLVAPIHWTYDDSLFYQAQVHELQGESQAVALHQAFFSKAAARLDRSLLASGDIRPANARGLAAWVNYSARFYRRRWLVPAMAAAMYPIAGDRSLLYVSALGYIATGLLLFALLRRRFPDNVSVIAAAACLLFPPLRTWAGGALTDSWGLALEVGALLAALLALERGGRWIALWFVSMVALSFTRDASIVLLVAVGWITIVTRTRRSAVVLATGIIASIWAPALFGAPLEEQLAYILHGFSIPGAVHLSYIVSHYPAAVWSVLRADVSDISNWGGHALVGYTVAAVFLASIGYMSAAAPRRDAFFTLQRAAAVGAAVTVALVVNFTAWRIELVFVPPMAVALAYTCERVFTGHTSARLARLVSVCTPIGSAGRKA